MIPESASWKNVLRLGLLIAGIGWSISFLFTFASWDVGVDHLRDMGARPIAYQPLLDYWLKMASATFGCIGFACLLACLRLREFLPLIRLLGPMHLFLAIVLGVSAWSNRFTLAAEPAFPADLTFCLLVAGLTQIPLMAGKPAKVAHD